MNSRDIRDHLASYDGVEVAPFRRVAESLDATEATVARLADMTLDDDASVEIGCTWIIKNLCERGLRPGEDVSSRLLSLLDDVLENESLLHLLQTIPYLALPAEGHAWLHEKLTELLTAEHKFVRAWAYNGFGVLARANANYRDEVLRLFERATKTEAASIRARIRHASKGL